MTVVKYFLAQSDSDSLLPSLRHSAHVRATIANPNAVVSIVVGLDPPQVELEGGRRVRLDPANPLSAGFAQILDALHTQRRPVYLEIDPATSAITRLLIPRVTRIAGVRSIDEGALYGPPPYACS